MYVGNQDAGVGNFVNSVKATKISFWSEGLTDAGHLSGQLIDLVPSIRDTTCLDSELLHGSTSAGSWPKVPEGVFLKTRGRVYTAPSAYVCVTNA